MSVSTPGPTPDARRYLTGFVLAIVLTAVPFAVVAFSLLSRSASVTVIVVAAVVQVVVHLRYFLHVDFKRTPLGNLLTLGFAAFLIFIMVGGSLWIMIDLHYRMMP
jgi:cytochrome o ubiquinol oxidase operon protein cyoD